MTTRQPCCASVRQVPHTAPLVFRANSIDFFSILSASKQMVQKKRIKIWRLAGLVIVDNVGCGDIRSLDKFLIVFIKWRIKSQKKD